MNTHSINPNTNAQSQLNDPAAASKAAADDTINILPPTDQTSSNTPTPQAGAQIQLDDGERWAIIEEVPKTSVGKFDKKVLRQRLAEGGLHVVVVEK